MAHEDLYANIKENDSEFVEVFDNFAFGEVLENTNLDDRNRMMVIISSLITNQAIEPFKIMVKEALNEEILSPVELKELLYQAFPYVGFGKAFDFLEVLNNVFEENNIELPLEDQSTTNKDNRWQKGYEIQCSFFGKDQIDGMRDGSPDDQIHFQDFLSGYCFGDFYTRKGLSDQDRELITFSIIATLGGCENQLRGHTAGNLSVGNDKEILIGAVTVLCPFIGFPRTLNALAIVNEIAGKLKMR